MAVEDKTLWTEVHSCLRDESVQIDSEQEQAGDLGAFISTLERTKPDLVLIDVSVLRRVGGRVTAAVTLSLVLLLLISLGIVHLFT